jgi:sialic acid synthase SpsE
MTEAQRKALQSTRDQYNNLKADLLQFKQTKVGTLLDEQNINV